MQLGRNLFQDHTGLWRIRFVGTELKVAQVKGVVKRYEFPFPTDLVPLLEEYLQVWRPKIAAEGETHVFINSRGKHFTQPKHVSDMIARTTYRFTGIGVTPHMFRDIWATEYLEANRGDVGGCARRLGNTPEMVMAHYAHILQASADERAEAFLQNMLLKGKTP
jgi:integrase